MHRRTILCWGFCCLCLIQTSCSRGPKKLVVPNKVPLSHVTGLVTVDGKPKQGVLVEMSAKGPIAETREAFTRGFIAVTDPDGNFSMSTYSRGDGLPHGEFVVWFRLVEQLPSGEKDLLGNQYSNRMKPYMTIKVVPDEDLDMGEIALKSAPAKGK